MGDEGRGTGACDHGVRVRELRALWGSRSRETVWDRTEDWWTPAVDAVCAAFTTGADPADASGRLGAARARAGIGIGRSLADLAAFTEAVEWGDPPLRLVRAMAEGWAEGARAANTCQDALTGLATPAYLRTRLGELYPIGDDGPPTVDHRLIVVTLDPTLDPWRRAARLIVLGYELRRFFDRGESVCLLSRSRIAVIAQEAEDLDGRLSELRGGPGWEHGAGVWAVPLPPALREAMTLIDGLGRADG
ncbi:hypothetical protein [Nocardiopsis lucentensis]|uniref:hypothetical protein n=1 Tax=Nocardiopsis lucentensis TaxID=53441 RepID=UPI0003465509|nr:hypothetical protein [Nocardiopsis lucentensis]